MTEEVVARACVRRPRLRSRIVAALGSWRRSGRQALRRSGGANAEDKNPVPRQEEMDALKDQVAASPADFEESVDFYATTKAMQTLVASLRRSFQVLKLTFPKQQII